MRQLPSRKPLSARLGKRLQSETSAIATAADARAEAAKRYGSARKAKWFAPVIETLKKMSGPGERCMFCSGSESSDLEHFRPKATFPELAMTWENYLWSCTPCNRGKGDRFPTKSGNGKLLINPVEEKVWDFFFIDEFGFLIPSFDREADSENERGVTTLNLIQLNREALRENRHARLKDLRQKIQDTLRLLEKGQISKQEARERLQIWKEQPWQPDVADYFLNGPGVQESPFDEFMESIARRDFELDT